MSSAHIHPTPLKLGIQLENMPHGVYRKLLVPDSINMLQLHGILQLAMGWTFSHLFQFMDTRQRPKLVASFGEIDPYENLPPNEFEAHDILLKRDFMERIGKKNLWYRYDYGDDWWHKISLLKPGRRDLVEFKGIPICTDAFGKCPPENVGGAWGYREFRDAIDNKNHPEYRSYREWLGLDMKTPYEQEKVSVPSINDTLKAYFHSREWSRDTQQSFQEGWVDFFESRE
ncbi:plasmid pRiA4b ORF-3 family protein [Cyclobacterium xiamenense]|jgi:hypothetical protein|uniref:plasmid pRiA4b ORF-3 family protein n=1 Tax=Cyclobacterium xiamenense TaxID=1297121 RepID=UPI0035D11212